jgi:rhodanese-related sulfurtransferase
MHDHLEEWLMRGDTPTISREELEARLDHGDDFILVETLPPPAFRDGHLPGAINLPPTQIQELAPKRLPDKSAQIVVYCAGPT